MDGLYYGFLLSIFFINFLASILVSLNSGISNVNYPLLTAFKIYSSFTPLNGGLPDNRIYNITPHDHTSHFSEYYSSITSGAI